MNVAEQTTYVVSSSYADPITLVLNLAAGRYVLCQRCIADTFLRSCHTVVESTPLAGDNEIATFKLLSYSPQIVQIAGRTINKYSVALLFIVFIGVFLRVYDLGVQSLWEDEASSVVISKMSLLQFRPLAADPSPPLYLFILHYWVALFGYFGGCGAVVVGSVRRARDTGYLCAGPPALQRGGGTVGCAHSRLFDVQCAVFARGAHVQLNGPPRSPLDVLLHTFLTEEHRCHFGRIRRFHDAPAVYPRIWGVCRYCAERLPPDAARPFARTRVSAETMDSASSAARGVFYPLYQLLDQVDLVCGEPRRGPGYQPPQ